MGSILFSQLRRVTFWTRNDEDPQELSESDLEGDEEEKEETEREEEEEKRESEPEGTMHNPLFQSLQCHIKIYSLIQSSHPYVAGGKLPRLGIEPTILSLRDKHVTNFAKDLSPLARAVIFPTSHTNTLLHITVNVNDRFNV